MRRTFHSGELEVQARVGVQFKASRLGSSLGNSIPPIAQQFLQERPLAIVTSQEANGAVWVSPLSGKPGFIEALDDRLVHIGAQPVPGDPLVQNLQQGGPIGLLFLDAATRRRMRINGQAQPAADGTLWVHTQQVYSNCPKYIRPRVPQPLDFQPTATAARHGHQFEPQLQSWIQSADTFFLGSVHPEAGADASHRGGPAGFVQVQGPRQLRFPDYAGNNLFQTLGNLTVSPAAGLLFLDFETGDALQLTGSAVIEWTEVAGLQPQRSVVFTLDRWNWLPATLKHRFRLLESSDTEI